MFWDNDTKLHELFVETKRFQVVVFKTVMDALTTPEQARQRAWQRAYAG